MANPFGPVVDNFELEKFPPFPNPVDIKQIDRARKALSWKTDNEKATQAQNHVNHLKAMYGAGASTHCLILNATGHTLKYLEHKDFYGRLYRTPIPWEIGNGQWVSFLHTQGSQAGSGSRGGILFRGINNSGQERDVFISWHTTGASPGGKDPNRVYADVKPKDATRPWPTWENNLIKGPTNRHVYTKEGFKIEVDIAQNTSPFYTAIITLPNA